MELPNQAIDEYKSQDADALRAAQMRMIWYLNALQIQPGESLFYAGKAMEQACRDGFKPDPQAAAMRCLQHVLRSHGIPDQDVLAFTYRRNSKSFRSEAMNREQCNVLRAIVFPIIKRGTMPAAELELKPWKRPSMALWRSLSQYFTTICYNTRYSSLFLVCLLLLLLRIGL